MSILTLAGRGALAGACAGIVTGLAALIFVEPVLDRAIELQHAAADDGHSAELFTRDTQQVGLLVAATLAGLAIGLIFGVVYAVLHRDDLAGDPWRRSLRLAGAGFVGISLFPFLRYPANPPGVGDPATIDGRTAGWLAAIVIGVATMAAVRLAVTGLARRDVPLPVRQLVPVAVGMLGAVLLLLLPPASDPNAVPADLLWTFRLLSVGELALLWASLGVGFGLAGLRAVKPVPAQVLG